MRWLVVLFCLAGLALRSDAQKTKSKELLVFETGQAIELDRVIPANERGILCLVQDAKGRIFGGTTGRAAHLFVCDPVSLEAKSLVRLPGGIGLAYALIALPDGSLIGGTHADPTGTAVETDAKAVGRLLRFLPNGGGPAKVEELGVPVPGQGIYTLAYDPKTEIVVGNTWPDGHFFSYEIKSRKFLDHGAIAGYRTFETPRHAEDLNKGSREKISYSRQVSRCIVVTGSTALTSGADGQLYEFDFESRKLAKTKQRLPAVPGRESWASLDAAVVHRAIHDSEEPYTVVMGGTSDGHFFELRLFDPATSLLRPRGRALAQGNVHGMVLAEIPARSKDGSGRGFAVRGVGGHREGMPRWFSFSHGGGTSAVLPGPIPTVDGQASMVGFGALIGDGKGNIYAGEQDRIGRLVRFGDHASAKRKPAPSPPPKLGLDQTPVEEIPKKLSGWAVFAPPGTTTDGSGYTAISVGLDGNVYVGSARYGGYAVLLRFDPNTRRYFMEEVVSLRELTGERLRGINTQGKIHAIIIVGPDGRIWFASKQAHEVFGTRPEYAEDLEGYPGGHLCYYDPKTGFSRSMGILKKQEGLMAGAMDKKRNRLYYRTEPKNLFVSFDIKTGAVREYGHVGASCRYMAIDESGAVYQTGRGNYLARFDPETNYIEDLAVKVEGPGHYSPPYVIQIGPNGKLYGAGTHHPWIMEFDIGGYKKGPFPEVTIRNIAPAAPPGLPVQDIHAGTFGKDGKFYYALLTTGPLQKGTKAEQHLRIMRFDPETKKVETVGIPDVEVDESQVKHSYVRGEKYKMEYIQGMAVGADGTLFVMDIYPQLNVVMFPKLTAPR
jgi:hypothetical protein